LRGNQNTCGQKEAVEAMAERTQLSTAKQALLDRWRAGHWAAQPTAIRQTAAVHRSRASIQQIELWNLHQRTPGTTSSNICFAAMVSAEIDEQVLARSVELLALRHESLRTTLSSADGVVWQHVHDEPATTLIAVDLSALGPDAALTRAQDLANEAARQPFDLVAGPLSRILLYRLGPREHLLAVIVHHAVADGWSLAIAMKETAYFYDAIIRGAPTDLPPLPVQYRDFAEWQWGWMDSAEAREHARYWDGRARHHCATQLPGDSPQSDHRSFRSGLAEIALIPGLTAAVRRLAAAEQASVFMVLLAAFAVLLHERTEDRVVSVGTPVACRGRPETHPLIGCFASMVPMFVTVRQGDTFRELLRSVRVESATALTHEEYPLDMYLNHVEPDRDFVDRPLYTAQLGLQPPMQPFELAGARLRPVSLDRGETRTCLAVHLWDAHATVHGTVGYSTAQLRKSTVDRLIERYMTIMERAAEDPSRRVSDL
jgi:non-ribosomal peptide synthetase component F